MVKVQGNTFVVTGGASGLGEATVLEFVRMGGNAVIFDLNEEKGTTLAKKLGSNAFFPGPVDVTSEEAVRTALERSVSRFGRLAGVVNCGGAIAASRIARPGKSTTTMSLDVFRFIIEVNLVGTFNVCRQVATILVNQEPFDEEGERGVIINTSSVAYQDGQTGQTAYSASKGGVASMTLPMARDLSPFGVRVVTIAPALFETNMTAEMLSEKFRLRYAEFPMRIGKPNEFARLACAIVENKMINGETIRIDGASRMGKL